MGLAALCNLGKQFRDCLSDLFSPQEYEEIAHVEGCNELFYPSPERIITLRLGNDEEVVVHGQQYFKLSGLERGSPVNVRYHLGIFHKYVVDGIETIEREMQRPS